LDAINNQRLSFETFNKMSVFVLRHKEDETKKPQKPRLGTSQSGFCTAAGENKETCSTSAVSAVQTIAWEKTCHQTV